ncbi:hypothetical protein SALBM217S_09078 [Streptomyces griseoloalbus]
MVRAWQEWGPGQPDEIWSSCHLENGGSPSVAVAAFSLGTYGELQNALDRLADRVGAPARSVTLRRHSYESAMEAYAGCSSFSTDAKCHLPGSTPNRNRQGALGRETYAAHSDFLDRFDLRGGHPDPAAADLVGAGRLGQHRPDGPRRSGQPRLPHGDGPSSTAAPACWPSTSRPGGPAPQARRRRAG